MNNLTEKVSGLIHAGVRAIVLLAHELGADFEAIEAKVKSVVAEVKAEIEGADQAKG